MRRVTINAPPMPETSSDARHNIILGIIVVLGMARGHAIASAPNWFKPHWALARLLYSTGRTGEARQEAALALDLDGRKDAEVVRTTSEIVRSVDSLP